MERNLVSPDNQTVCHPIELGLPAIYDSAVFLRPHHLLYWEWVISNPDGIFSSKSYEGWSSINHALIGQRRKKAVLEDGVDPKKVGVEIDILGIFNPANKEPTKEELEALRNTPISIATYIELARRESVMFQSIWEKPATTTVVIAMVVDNMCRLISEQGHSHCRTDAQDYIDKLTVEKILQYKQDPAIDLAKRDQIQLIPAFRHPDKIQAITIPLSLLKDKRFIIGVSMQEIQDRT